ncbi:MAG TPA: GGDEF domain-containing protein [Capillimicrobium sp.]
MEDARATTWLCPTAAHRDRLLDMERRLKPVRAASLAILGVALVACGPWIGWWTLLPLALAALGFAVVDRGLDGSARPEYRIAGAWAISVAAIAGAVAAAGGPTEPFVAWLIIPVVTLPARFGQRGLAAGAALVGLAIVGVTVGVGPGAVADEPQLVLVPLAMLAAVALLSVALMRSDLQHRSEAVIDPLTGMLNRGALANRASELAQQAAVVDQPIALIVGDLDRFKAVNDGHGHAAGDAVLQEVAYRIRKQLRSFDLAYRVGGEEFVVVVPGAAAPQALEIAEDLRGIIRETPMAGLHVTMSFGVAASPPGSFDFDAVFAAADLALYNAKRLGRDRVCADEAPGAAVSAPSVAL